LFEEPNVPKLNDREKCRNKIEKSKETKNEPIGPKIESFLSETISLRWHPSIFANSILNFVLSKYCKIS